MAKINLGNTAENPSVGCVIVQNNQIISAATTEINGRPHAEIIAINKVQNKQMLIGATMFVTLEPCSHYGKTDPCVFSIIKYQIARVVICHQDIDSRVNGLGIKTLQEANIEVILLCGPQEAKDKFFFHAKQHKKAWLTAKIATSLDGKIATKQHQSKWLTSDKARRYGNFLRSKYQAIMVGANTVKQDNPSLDCRITGLDNLSPLKIIVSTKLDFSFDETIFSKPATITYIATTYHQQNNPKLQQWLAKTTNNKVIFLPLNKYNLLDLELLLEELQQQKINSVLLEGGGTLLTGFLQKNLVQELIWIRNVKIIGNDAIAAVHNLNLLSLADSLHNLTRTQCFMINEEDLVEIFVKKYIMA
jgi:diaminohydroxyphosphoribosylaminopyrimidine deaminase/5-amino-6-(5-phosphoribosylamino)uracil reductase